MRVLGIDYGGKRMGLALSDPLGIIAHGLPNLNRTDIDTDINELQGLVDERGIVEIVVGLPKNMNNTLGGYAKEVLVFVGILKKRISVPIQTLDERLSVVMGHNFIQQGGVSLKKRKKKVDMIAAQLILQKYLDCKGNSIQTDDDDTEY